MTKLKEKADLLAEKTQDAYSVNAYSPAGWRACALYLLKLGSTMDEAETVLRSKWMRWAGDQSKYRYGCYTSGDLKRFFSNESDPLKSIQDLHKGIIFH